MGKPLRWTYSLLIAIILVAAFVAFCFAVVAAVNLAIAYPLVGVSVFIAAVILSVAFVVNVLIQ